MSTVQIPEATAYELREGKLEAYRLRADPAIALISTFYLVLLLIPHAVITSWQSSLSIQGLDALFWVIITADIAYRVRLNPNRRARIALIAGLVLLLTGPFVYLDLSEGARNVIRLALIAVVSLRAINSVRYFFRLRSIIYIISAVILIVLVFGVLMAFTERDEPNSNITSLGLGLWWAVVTVSTVGYGDTYPVTNAGRAIATGLMFFGVAMFSILTATLANSFASRAEDGATDQFVSLHERLDRIERHQLMTPAAGRRIRAPTRPRRKTPTPTTGTEPVDKE